MTESTKPLGIKPLAAAGIVAGILLAIARALIWAKDNIDGQVQGYALGGILISGAIAYLIAGRKKVRNQNVFATWFFSLNAFFLLTEWFQRLHR